MLTLIISALSIKRLASGEFELFITGTTESVWNQPPPLSTDELLNKDTDMCFAVVIVPKLIPLVTRI